MARRAFFSFEYKPDAWRTSQVRNAGLVEGNVCVSDNAWESITRGGDAAIQRWIDDQLDGKSCAIVLIGSTTAGRKWINYEICKAWNDRKGVLGVYIHNLLDALRRPSVKGSNPFEGITFGEPKSRLSTVVKAYDPPYAIGTDVYAHIKANLANWVEEAVSIRERI